MNLHECGLVNVNHKNHSHVDGTFYKMPDKLPCVLHDRQGCVFLDEKAFRDCVDLGQIRISHAKDGDKINVAKGISQLSGYTRCESADDCPKARFRKK